MHQYCNTYYVPVYGIIRRRVPPSQEVFQQCKMHPCIGIAWPHVLALVGIGIGIGIGLGWGSTVGSGDEHAHGRMTRTSWNANCEPATTNTPDLTTYVQHPAGESTRMTVFGHPNCGAHSKIFRRANVHGFHPIRDPLWSIIPGLLP